MFDLSLFIRPPGRLGVSQVLISLVVYIYIHTYISMCIYIYIYSIYLSLSIYIYTHKLCLLLVLSCCVVFALLRCAVCLLDVSVVCRLRAERLDFRQGDSWYVGRSGSPTAKNLPIVGLAVRPISVLRISLLRLISLYIYICIYIYIYGCIYVYIRKPGGLAKAAVPKDIGQEMSGFAQKMVR